MQHASVQVGSGASILMLMMKSIGRVVWWPGVWCLHFLVRRDLAVSEKQATLQVNLGTTCMYPVCRVGGHLTSCVFFFACYVSTLDLQRRLAVHVDLRCAIGLESWSDKN
jgi:hypothetical protein